VVRKYPNDRRWHLKEICRGGRPWERQGINKVARLRPGVEGVRRGGGSCLGGQGGLGGVVGGLLVVGRASCLARHLYGLCKKPEAEAQERKWGGNQ